jgi:hypothetical protein
MKDYDDLSSWEEVGDEGLGEWEEASPEHLAEAQSIKEHPTIAAFAKRFPELAEKFGNLKLPENYHTAGRIAGHANKAIEATGLPAFGGGVVESVANTGTSIANLIPGVDIPYADLRKHLPKGFLNSAMFGGGKIGGDILSFMAGSGALGKAGKVAGLARPAGWAGIGSDVLKNAAVGGALGGGEYGGRGLSAALGGLGGLLSNASPTRAAKHVIEGSEAAKKVAKQTYEPIFKAAEAGGLNKGIKAPHINVDAISKGIDSKGSRDVIKSMMKSPTIENMHRAKSDITKFINKTAVAAESGNASSTVLEARRAAIAAKDKIQKALTQALTKGNDKRLAEQLVKADTHYAKEVVPYFNKALVKAQQLQKQTGKTGIGSAKAVKSLMKDEVFKAAHGGKYPEVAISNYAPTLAKMLGIGGGLGAAGAGISHLTKGNK